MSVIPDLYRKDFWCLKDALLFPRALLGTEEQVAYTPDERKQTSISSILDPEESTNDGGFYEYHPYHHQDHCPHL